MGGPMARHLAQAGHEMVVYNRTRAKAENWVAQHGGTVASSPAEAGDGVDAVISCVGADEDLAAVTLGRDGAFRTMKAGSVFIDHTTVSARIARQLPQVSALHAHVAARPRIAAYLASARRLPFNQQGIFRNYAELDP